VIVLSSAYPPTLLNRKQYLASGVVEWTPALRSCAWCGRRIDLVPRRSAAGVICGGCGVANTDPWPTDAELDPAYGSWCRPSSGRFSGLGDVILRRTRGQLAQRIDRIAPPGPVLDVGAGDGALLGVRCQTRLRKPGENESQKPGS
jgi:hypothetical protein